jgi:hypothetical protein
MNVWIAPVLAALIFLPIIGFARKVKFDYDHKANLASCHSHRIVRIAESPVVSQLVDQRVVAAEKIKTVKREV